MRPPPAHSTARDPRRTRPMGCWETTTASALRAVYPSSAYAIHLGSISGRILPANPLSLPASPPGVTGIFGAHAVAVDTASGAVIAGTISGWSCTEPGPAQFDGSFAIERLSVGHNYTIYAEPLNSVVAPAQITPAIVWLCRNSTTDAGWPPLQSCLVPAVNINFTPRTRPG